MALILVVYILHSIIVLFYSVGECKEEKPEDWGLWGMWEAKVGHWERRRACLKEDGKCVGRGLHKRVRRKWLIRGAWKFDASYDGREC